MKNKPNYAAWFYGIIIVILIVLIGGWVYWSNHNNDPLEVVPPESTDTFGPTNEPEYGVIEDTNEPIIFPDVVGMHIDDASVALCEVDCVFDVTYQYEESSESLSVLEQSIAPGTEFSKDALCTLLVNSKTDDLNAAEKKIYPNLLGVNVDAAMLVLSQSGYGVSHVMTTNTVPESLITEERGINVGDVVGYEINDDTYTLVIYMPK